MHPMRILLISTALLHAAPLLAGIPIDETRAVDADAVIDIDITNGRVTITGWDRNEFRISGELGDAVDSYDLRVVGGGIRFDENTDRRSRWPCWNRNCYGGRGDHSVLDIRVPHDSLVQFEGVNVEVELDDLRANSTVEVVNGSIRAQALGGVVKLETVNGSIDASGLSGRIDLETVNGSIKDVDSSGTRVTYSTINGDIRSNTGSARISAENVNGLIDMELGTLDELELSTVGGRVDVTTGMSTGGHIRISSVSGRVDLTVPADISARFNVSTAVGGRIDNRLSDEEPVRENRFINSSELRLSLNGGDGDIQISTVTGNVTLRGR